MSSPVAAVKTGQAQLSVGGIPLERLLFLALAFIALFYAALAGLRTVEDPDLGWQMATGRWVIQHHQIPSVDVLSYTAQGRPWIYPIGSQVIFYLAYLLGGFALISCMHAAACAGSIALLLRRGSLATAVLAFIAVPLIAARTTPRADMFTVVLFAAYLSLLWGYHETGKARLWLLPVLMVAWVNLHPGFISGLGLVLAYAAAELLEAPFGAARRRAALARLRRAWPWLLATALATLVNPWGWGMYRALVIYQRANAQERLWIYEWAPLPLTFSSFSQALSLRGIGGAIYLLIVVACVSAVIALLRRRWISATLLAGAIYPAVKAVRMEAVFACVVVVVAGPELYAAGGYVWQRMKPAPARWVLAGVAAVAFVAVAELRCFDIVTNHVYHASTLESVFGVGLCSWFPERAAQFIRQQNLPGEVFNTYAAGGFMAWSLGPSRRVYIDGRDIMYGSERLARHSQLLFSDPDSAVWREEANAYNINTVVFGLLPVDGLQHALLRMFCASTTWSPVYLDERSAVFVRNVPQNAAILRQFPVNCRTTLLPAASADLSRSEAFNTWTNAAVTLAALQRNDEALAAYQKALSMFDDSAFVHWNYANLLLSMGETGEAQREYLMALALDPSPDAWHALAQSYLQQGRTAAAAHAMEQEAQYANKPYLTLSDLGYVYLGMNEPAKAVTTFDRAARATPAAIRTIDGGSFEAKIALGRSLAWSALGNLQQGTAYAEEAVKLQPGNGQLWQQLAKLYQAQGRTAEAERARQQAVQLGTPASSQ